MNNQISNPAAANRSMSNQSSSQDLVLSRTFEAPPSLVYQAWTDPKHFTQWWGPQHFTNSECILDVRPGGIWRIVMRGPDGATHPCKGLFREVVPNERLVMTVDHSELPAKWHDLVDPNRDKSKPVGFETLNTVTFDDLGGKTKLTLRVQFPSAAIRAGMLKVGMVEGWSQSIDRLHRFVAGEVKPLVIERVFNATAAQLWQAITTKEAMKQWYFDLAEFEPEVGFQFRFDVEHEGNKYIHLCEVIDVVPQQKLAYTWRYDGQPGNSLVTWELIPEGDKTRLRLSHAGLDTFPKLPDYAVQNFTDGWTAILGQGLKNFIEGAPAHV